MAVMTLKYPGIALQTVEASVEQSTDVFDLGSLWLSLSPEQFIFLVQPNV